MLNFVNEGRSITDSNVNNNAKEVSDAPKGME